MNPCHDNTELCDWDAFLNPDLRNSSQLQLHIMCVFRRSLRVVQHTGSSNPHAGGRNSAKISAPSIYSVAIADI